ncbi:hypothetical protein B0H67DRAFT_188117 [Lasiosphaeris hirsuta]|uniref:Uncharacterized protein n=1 Tax=Lasiosphaeris hirsuta TaxID=260670 RepID=A0AA40E157_9PEZI|nr:hypothetical protein B0H67DRAFT_188117 [Lasiosphaeris hirsuta]
MLLQCPQVRARSPLFNDLVSSPWVSDVCAGPIGPTQSRLPLVFSSSMHACVLATLCRATTALAAAFPLRLSSGPPHCLLAGLGVSVSLTVFSLPLSGSCPRWFHRRPGTALAIQPKVLRTRFFDIPHRSCQPSPRQYRQGKTVWLSSPMLWGSSILLSPRPIACGLPLFEEAFQPGPRRPAVIATVRCQVPGTALVIDSCGCPCRPCPVFGCCLDIFSAWTGPSTGINSTSVLPKSRVLGNGFITTTGIPRELP